MVLTGKQLFLVLIFLIFSVFPAFSQTPDTSEQPSQTPGFFIAPLIEVNGYSRKGPAFAGGLAMGAGRGIAIGWRFLYAVDTESSNTMEIGIFLRFYLKGSNAVAGPFIQFHAGAAIYELEGSPSFPSEAGSPSVGIAAGWRFQLGERWYIEPAIRAGYPYIIGMGVSAAYQF